MADTPAAVTDTHPLLFHAAGTGRLGKRAKAHFDACERREAMVYVPMVVIWECALLARAARVNLRRSVHAFFDDLFSNPAYQPYDLGTSQVFAADETRVNRDPFDGLICAAALDLGLPLLTRDRDIESWGRIQTIW